MSGSSAARARARLRALPNLGTNMGVAMVVIGIVLLTIAWGGAAGTLEVGRQIPYVISGGIGGMGIILVGLAVIQRAARRRDAVAREQRLVEIRMVLEQVRGLMAGGDQ